MKNLSTFFMVNGRESAGEKAKFRTRLSNRLGRLPNDFDYDLSKDTLVYFVPLRNIERIIEREKFRLRTEEVLRLAKDKSYASLYVMSPSAAEWFWSWGTELATSFKTTRFVLNRDVHEVKESLHFENIENGIEQLNGIGPVEFRSGIRHGLTLAFVESEELISGRAVFFMREGKASSFSPIFIKEEGEVASNSDIFRLKQFFDESFKSQN